MSLACAMTSNAGGWTSLAILGVPLLGILFARIVMMMRSSYRGSGRVDRRLGGRGIDRTNASALPEFPLETSSEPESHDLVGV